MGRKYKQQGYQDEAKTRSGAQKRGQKSTSEGPRSPRMPGFQEVMRCAMCGQMMPVATDITADSRCPQCGADLRSCKHCRYFDTGARFECTQTIPQRIVQKGERNDCEFFEARTAVERETSSPVSATGGAATGKDARSAFDDLFR